MCLKESASAKEILTNKWELGCQYAIFFLPVIIRSDLVERFAENCIGWKQFFHLGFYVPAPFQHKVRPVWSTGGPGI